MFSTKHVIPFLFAAPTMLVAMTGCSPAPMSAAKAPVSSPEASAGNRPTFNPMEGLVACTSDADCAVEEVCAPRIISACETCDGGPMKNVCVPAKS